MPHASINWLRSPVLLVGCSWQPSSSGAEAAHLQQTGTHRSGAWRPASHVSEGHSVTGSSGAGLNCMQVQALVSCPSLLEHPEVGKLFPKDAIARAKHMLTLIPGGVGVLLSTSSPLSGPQSVSVAWFSPCEPDSRPFRQLATSLCKGPETPHDSTTPARRLSLHHCGAPPSALPCACDRPLPSATTAPRAPHVQGPTRTAEEPLASGRRLQTLSRGGMGCPRTQT